MVWTGVPSHTPKVVYNIGEHGNYHITTRSQVSCVTYGGVWVFGVLVAGSDYRVPGIIVTPRIDKKCDCRTPPAVSGGVPQPQPQSVSTAVRFGD